MKETSIRTGASMFLTQDDYINVSQPVEENLLEMQYASTPEFNAKGNFRNIALLGMAATDEHSLASDAVLINKGRIDIHLKELCQYCKDNGINAGRCMAMAAGAHSTLINEGIINVYMDQDPDSDIIFYCNAMFAGPGSLFVNKGEIHYIGCGSWQSLIRGVGGMANDLYVVNEGLITVDVERAYQTKILHTAGWGCFLINNGTIKIRVAGRIMAIGGISGSAMVNNGVMEIESIATLLECKIPFLYEFPPLASALYEHFHHGTDHPARPVVNTGSISIKLIGSEASGPDAVAFGFYYIMEEPGETPVRYLSNEGTIKITQEGPDKYLTGDVGVNVQSKKDVGFTLCPQKWHIGDRDFEKDPVFCIAKGEFDFSNSEFDVEIEDTAKLIHRV